MNELSIFNSLLNDVLGGDYSPAMYCPKVDVKEEQEKFTLEMDLPGLSEKDVNIQVQEDNLTIESKKQECKEEKNKKENYILKERCSSSFKRQFSLPKNVDSNSITATFKNGVLSIYMQKKEIQTPKLIEIKAV